MNKFVNFYYDHGFIATILIVLLSLGATFGLMCAFAALFMVCWNFAVVAAIAVCTPIPFWVAFVFCLAIRMARIFCNLMTVKTEVEMNN